MIPKPLLLAALSLLLFGSPRPSLWGADRPNVLFIAVDDLRPQLNCYGETQMHSPNIDKLASGGMLFEQAYCMVPTCGASRAALMTGIRPSRNRFITHLTWAEKDAPGITTMNTHFKQNGYETISLGKIFHHPTDSQEGWSQPAWRPQGGYMDPANKKIVQRRRDQGDAKPNGPAFEAYDAPEDEYQDAKLAARAKEELQRLSKADTPFFLAVGFFKPHLPFVCPKKYWDLYDHDAIQVPANYHPPKDAPEGAVHSSGELRAYAGIPKQGVLSEEDARNLIHGYYACVSFTDAQIGKVLDELERLDLAKNTIVVLWGDHGWNLGDHTMWCKHSCFESSLHIPLIVRAPGKSATRTRALIETIDIYPSLCELTGLPTPEHCLGRSFVPLFNNPSQPWKGYAISRFTNGDSLRTDQFRFSEYTTEQGHPTGRMLYDHATDGLENFNLSEHPQRQPLVEQLTKQLHEGKGKNGELLSGAK
jgi:arylsulfatase A-like enzyme